MQCQNGEKVFKSIHIDLEEGIVLLLFWIVPLFGVPGTSCRLKLKLWKCLL